MLTTAEVSKKLRLDQRTIRRMIERGEIDAIDVGRGAAGRKYRISEEALAAYIKRQTVRVAT